MEIHFEFEGVRYKVIYPFENDYPDLIKLPDGRVLWISRWLESMPPIPTDMKALTLTEAVLDSK